jgi:tetratricopeptide (TPR) repeat protein
MSDDEERRHDELYKRAWALAKPEMQLHGRSGHTGVGLLARWRLYRAARMFLQVVSFRPTSWPSLWALGKIEQRLGNRGAALDWFAKAHEIEPTQADVAREAGLEALASGRAEKAVTYCEAALRARPDDPGLVANLALAYCLAGRDAEATRRAAEAVARNPADSASLEAQRLVLAVASGARQRPQRI